MAHIGYIRVSKHEQNEALQMDALKAAGCEQFYTDKITGSTFERQGLDEAVAYLRTGDTFVVWKLDRAGRSLSILLNCSTLLRHEVSSLSASRRKSTRGHQVVSWYFTSWALWPSSSGT